MLEDVETFTKAQNRRALRAEKKARQMLKSQGVKSPVTNALRGMIEKGKSDNRPIVGFILSKFQIENLMEENKQTGGILCFFGDGEDEGEIHGVPFEIDPGLLARGVAFHDQDKFNDAAAKLGEFKRRLKGRDGIRSSIQPGEGEL